MARSVTRWVVAGLLACCAVAVALLPPRESGVRYSMSLGYIEPARLNRERLRFEDAIARLRLLRLRDSLPGRSDSKALDPRGRLRVIADPGIPARVVDVVALLSEQSWDRSEPHDSAISVVVAALIDTAGEVEGFRREVPWGMRSAYLVPTAEDEPRCVRVVDFGWSELEAIADGQSPVVGAWRMASLRRGIGSCAYYAAFGVPGKDIARWLVAWHYLPIANADWTGSEPEERYAWLHASQQLGRLWFHADFMGCAAGDLSRCGLALWKAPGQDRWPARLAGLDAPGVVYSGRSWSYGYRYGDGLGPAAAEYLGDMVGRFGRERFQRFWTSDAPFEEAFREAMGVPLDEWTMEWARTYVGAPRTAGHVPWGSAVLSLALAAVVVGAAGLYAVWREVG